MYNRLRNLLVSNVNSIQARLTDKSAAGASDPLGADVGSHFEELPGCHPGTFNAVLLRLLDWATADPTPFVCWLTGPSGIGKSAIARSLVAHLKLEDRSIACVSLNRTRNSVKSLVPTLARQIARAIPEFQSQNAKVVAFNSRGSKQSVQSQFEKFIVNPILQLNLSPARRRASLPVVVVIDGLDECDDKERCLFLKTVLEAAPRLRRYLKFLVISRPDSNIQNFFEQTSIQDDINVIDLSTYLSHAQTEKKSLLPPGSLHDSAHAVDHLFRTIISSSTTNQMTIGRLLSVVLVCLQTDVSPMNPLKDTPMSLTYSDRFMESILDLEPKSLQSALLDLKSLMSFRRKMTHDGRPFHDVRIINFSHRSLKDYLLDKTRSREFHIDLKAACLTVAKGILRILAEKSRTEQRYWTLEAECDPWPAYHNCLVWCYERLTPDEDLQRAIMEYDPIDYLSSMRKSITYATAVAFFTFACKSLRRFEDLQSPFDDAPDISNHLRSHLDRYLSSELDHWLPQNFNFIRALKAFIFPDHIDWESFRSSEEMVECVHKAILSRLGDDPFVGPEYLPYFLLWIFDKGLGYAGGTVERTVCSFFYSANRAGKYYIGVYDL